LIHFPIALKYVDPTERYPPEWYGVDGKTVELQNTPLQETWVAMEELVDLGLVKNIGIRYLLPSLVVSTLMSAVATAKVPSCWISIAMPVSSLRFCRLSFTRT
jgi:D-xylose reductase